eukprot:6371004-Amphidinium_carterae.1
MDKNQGGRVICVYRKGLNSRLLCDNIASIVSSNTDPLMPSRHWSIRAWKLRGAINTDEVSVKYISTSEQRVDSFTT